MAKRSAIYAGSFDWLTLGHLWMIQESAKLFDELIVAIGDNPAKKYRFSLADRMDQLTEATKDIPNVKIMHFTGKYLVRFAQSLNVQYIVRGIRNDSDYSQERDMRYINAELNSKIQTLFLIPPKNLAEVSSSLVKQLVGPQGWEKVVKSYVPEPVYKKVLHHELLANFQLVWAKLSGNPDLAKQKAPEILTTLIDHYLETHRHYHNISHILDCCNELSSLQQISPDDYYRLYVALWFHDVIYDTKAKDNEQKSADLFVKMATDSQFNAGDIQIINDLILATQTHVGKTQLEVLMLDIDLSILGRDIETFDCYDLDIRKEYHWVPDDAYEAGRKKIMNGFFLRAKIFQTKEFSDRYEAQAKENLKKFNT